jgi:hypothetical protein
MTWDITRRALAAIPKGLRPSVRGRGLPDRFSYDAAGCEATAGATSRRWWGRVLSGAGEGPYQVGQSRMRVMWEVVVEYIDDAGSGEKIDEAIVSDATLLGRAFAFGGNWDRANGSGIVSVTAAGDAVAPFEVEYLDGVRRLRMTLDVRYTTTLTYDNIQTYDDADYSYGGL